MEAIKSVRQCFEKETIMKILDGGNIVRIDAKTKNYIADKNNFFSKWVSYKYANNLCKEYYNKSLEETSVFI